MWQLLGAVLSLGWCQVRRHYAKPARCCPSTAWSRKDGTTATAATRCMLHSVYLFLLIHAKSNVTVYDYNVRVHVGLRHMYLLSVLFCALCFSLHSSDFKPIATPNLMLILMVYRFWINFDPAKSDIQFLTETNYKRKDVTYTIGHT